ncbi:DUF4062 domain-containing protein [Exiguobacterium sp. s140]|uniref:DUF4062 domain-containing protein n=1 Tax=Exiguobacterium sp. s140 TaxID=2751290 RepID=UPI001BE53A4C|nr:DUF4062 domain-containing protein [Exiguobacterium sp. s140]
MLTNRKLQIFISSTYEDLRLERDRATKVILKTNHIPAGMELFRPGTEDSKKVIRRWIDESDAYILILGYRYGSIDSDSGLSFTHWEYEYARESGKELFCVLLDTNKQTRDKRILDYGPDIFEQINPDKFNDFRELVRKNHQSSFFKDLNTLENVLRDGISDFENKIIDGGWVRASSIQNRDEIKLVSKNQTINLVQIDDMIRNQKLTPNELLLLSYAQDKQIYELDYGQGYNQRIKSIRKWEKDNYFYDYTLSDAYSSTLKLLKERRIVRESSETDNDLPVAYYLDIDFYTELVASNKYKDLFDTIKQPYQLKPELRFDDDLPF